MDQADNPNNGNARERLLSEAARLFMEHGYERTTMRNIASATGIKLGSIAYYFKSKDEILFEAMKTVIEAGETRAFSAVSKANTPEAKLRALINTELSSFLHDKGAITIKEWRCLDDMAKNSLLEHYKAYHDLWLQVLEECRQQGVIRCRPEIARQFIRGAFAWSETWYRSEGELMLEDLVDEMINLITQIKPAGG